MQILQCVTGLLRFHHTIGNPGRELVVSGGALCVGLHVLLVAGLHGLELPLQGAAGEVIGQSAQVRRAVLLDRPRSR